MPYASTRLFSLTLLFLLSFALLASGQSSEDDDLDMIELEGFEVFSNSMTIIDGITGKEWDGNHPVVLGFRRDFDPLLLKFHKRLLLEEHRKLKVQFESAEPLKQELTALAASFGFTGEITLEQPRLTRENAIFRRMIEDPFFNIDKLVVWDLNGLRVLKNELPDNKYAKNIRLNEETGKWERRILTKWDVSYVRYNKNGNRNPFFTYKEQGLNLDTNRGFHLIDVGLPADVPPHAFRDVGLEYPIFVDTAINVEEQIRELSRDFIENLFYIYDPFSWVARGNTRFHYGYPAEMHSILRSQRLKVQDRDWFNRVISEFLNDVALLKYWSPDVIYAKQMASSSPKNRNILGEDLDLLNWHKKEKRRVDYDPDVPSRTPHIGFDHARGARFILLDAYRRYGDKVVEALRSRILSMEENADVKQLVKDALEEASGVPASKYIPAASRAQKAELERFLRP